MCPRFPSALYPGRCHTEEGTGFLLTKPGCVFARVCSGGDWGRPHVTVGATLARPLQLQRLPCGLSPGTAPCIPRSQREVSRPQNAPLMRYVGHDYWLEWNGPLGRMRLRIPSTRVTRHVYVSAGVGPHSPRCPQTNLEANSHHLPGVRSCVLRKCVCVDKPLSPHLMSARPAPPGGTPGWSAAASGHSLLLSIAQLYL